ncbi:MAG: Hsp20/alpha crystallin family protein [Bacteroidetes bacterium]|nr:Hsp20/alpha crystallin family protein [Bacteroidota bacterium]
MIPMLRNTRFLPSFTDDFFGKDFMADVFDSSVNKTIPEVNVIENAEAFKIEVAAPGLDKKDFKIDVNNNVLTISSEKEAKNVDEKEKFIRREFSYSSFQRSFSLPESVDQDKINAKHKDGILMVEIPKRDEAKEKPKREIKIS